MAVTGIGSDALGGLDSVGSVKNTLRDGGNANNNTDSIRRSSTAMGFGTTNVQLMSSGAGSEYVNRLTAAITEAYKKYNFQSGDKPRVSVFDNQVLKKFIYSVIVIHVANGNNVSYFTVLLAATGPKLKTAAEIVSEYKSIANSRDRFNMYDIKPNYVPADAMHDKFHEEIKNTLASQYGNKKLNAVDGLIVPHTVSNVEEVATEIAAIAYNSCNLDNLLADGLEADINIALAKEMAPNSVLKAEANLLTPTSVDSVTNPVRTDFVLELNSVNTQNNMRNGFMENPVTNVVQAGGYIDSLPDAYMLQPAPNMAPIPYIRLRPHIVLTHLGAYATTPGLAMLALLTGMIMANNDMYLACLLPRDGQGSFRNTGALNMLTNIEKNQTGIGEIINLADKKRSPDELYAILRSMYSLSSYVSLDVELYGTQTSYTSMFAVAAEEVIGIGANEDAIAAKKNASRKIIQVANWLTNGAFPLNFNPDGIFAASGVPVPTGKIADKAGERDIRDIDAAFIASHSNDPNMIREWALSNLPKTITGKDPYMTKVDIISKLVPNAIITGKAIRVTFSDAFINTLIDSAHSSGYDVKYEPQVKVLQNDAAMIGHYMHNAGISSGATTFARQHAMAGPNYQTTYGFGGNRYGR